MKPIDVLKSPKWLVGVALGGVLLGIAISQASSSEGADPGASAPERELEPGRFVITENSWGTDPVAPVDDDEWQELGESEEDQEKKERLAQQARERWQNLDIAIRGR